MRWVAVAIAIVFNGELQGQWTIQESHTTAGLRGVCSVSERVAWASGTNGTVLRTTNGGETWRACPVPPGAEKLDFRGVQAFGENTAVVMSAGKRELSRVYKTTDGCRTWKLVFTNPDEDGFWDALQFRGPDLGLIVGDQVRNQFPVFVTVDGGDTWKRIEGGGIGAEATGQSIFAASNTSMLIGRDRRTLYFITGGGKTAFIEADLDSGKTSYTHPELAIGESAGGFSIASRRDGSRTIFVVVGGDYKSPDEPAGTAATRVDGRWQPADVTPHGFRSAVAYDAARKIWIAVGPNGTDISSDDGRTWHAGDSGDAGRNWNALSLPFVVGPRGRIGKLGAGQKAGCRQDCLPHRGVLQSEN